MNDDSGLVELINDNDKNIVLKITNNAQILKIVSTNGTKTNTQAFNLTNLVLLDS